MLINWKQINIQKITKKCGIRLVSNIIIPYIESITSKIQSQVSY